MDNIAQEMLDNRAMVSAEGAVRFSNPSGNCVEILSLSDGTYRIGDTTDRSRVLCGDLAALRDTVRANGR